MKQNKNQKSYFRIGDLVQIIVGQKKGILGNVISINKKKQKVSLKELKEQNESNIKIEPILIHISNIMLWDSEKKKVTRIGYKIIDGEKKRYSKKSGNFI